MGYFSLLFRNLVDSFSVKVVIYSVVLTSTHYNWTLQNAFSQNNNGGIVPYTLFRQSYELKFI